METQASQILQFIRPSGIFSAVLVLAITWLFGRILTHLTGRLAASFGRQRLLIRQTASLLRFGLYVLGVLVGLRLIFDVSSEVLAVVGGTIVVTVGLVLKDQAASILAGVTILVEKPFRVGDRVSFGGYYG
ncbi:MAG: mechanosensitive ion channel domain-containing protein, partial [Myxococcota bacterium]|nr:mechanosensitive ion channel domain-containing protein [Myxococcota bacterium]